MSLENCPSSLLNLSDTELVGEETHSYRFETFELNPSERRLFHHGEVVPLTPKAFEILTVLVTRAGHLVKKEEIMETVWADAFVEETNLTRLVHTLRKTLGENENGAKFIETVAKQGYRFVGEVTRVDAERGDASDVWPHIVTGLPATGPVVPTTHRPIVLFSLGAVATLGMIVILSLTWRGERTDPGTQSIAVLPFRLNGTANRNEEIDLAFANELINQLGQSKNLKVRSFNTIRKYANEDADPSIIGRDQKVDYVLVSNYFVEGDDVKGTSELYNVQTGSVDATFPFQGTNAKLFDLSDSIASAIRPGLLAKLRAEPVESAQKRGTASEDAWRYYLDGIKLINKRTKVDAQKAVAELESAVRIDPEFAYGFVHLAQAHQTSVVNGALPSEHCAKSLEAAERAVQLQPNLGDAHTALGGATNFCANDRPTAETYLRRGVELAPNSYYTHTLLGAFLTHRGGAPDESIEEIERAIDLNPDLVWLQRLLGRAYYFARRYGDAIPQFEKAWQLDPGEVEQALLISSAYELKGDLDHAFDWFLIAEKSAGRDGDADAWRQLYSGSGWSGVLRKRFERAVGAPKETTNDFFEVVHTGASLGEIDKTLGYYGTACSKPGRILTELPVDPYLDPLRSDPRWGETVSRCWKTGDAY